jgi:hypothetical protein
MEHMFTSEEILAYVYNDLDAETAAKLEYMMTRDGSLRNEINHCRGNKALLDLLPLLNPADNTIHHIIRYAEEQVGEAHSLELFQ